MTDKSQKNKKQKQERVKNVLETLGDIGAQTTSTIANETKAVSDEFFKQLLGQQAKLQEKKSGVIGRGESLQMSDVMSGKSEQEKRMEEQMFFERRLFAEERQETAKKLQELRLKLQAIISEAAKLASATQSLGEEVKVAILNAPENASQYQISFYENLVQLIISFRKKIDGAVLWMQGMNKRAEKKNYWSQYKKKGASFLLSGEHYSQRSAG